MEATLQALGQLLLKGVPTIFLLLVVHFYLKGVFFRPMGDVLAKRRAATDGLKENAASTRTRAEGQAKSIEAQLQQAREAIYQEQEEARRRWMSEQGVQLDDARQKARDLIHQAKLQLDDEAASTKVQLQAAAGPLADEIANALLERTPA
jgi:F-type H+-transporting ATPase subunit b